MPRLSPSYLRRAHSLSPLLPLLLRSCRDLPTARNELRWLREHVLAGPCSKSLYELCVERSKGKPLQYILGNQPFGDINVLCEPGVLIPRLVIRPGRPSIFPTYIKLSKLLTDQKQKPSQLTSQTYSLVRRQRTHLHQISVSWTSAPVPAASRFFCTHSSPRTYPTSQSPESIYHIPLSVSQPRISRGM